MMKSAPPNASDSILEPSDCRQIEDRNTADQVLRELGGRQLVEPGAHDGCQAEPDVVVRDPSIENEIADLP